MPWNWCEECRTAHAPGAPHLPEFRAGIPEYDGGEPEDYPKIRASEAEDAAEKYAEQFDNGDYTIMRGNDVTVIVLDARGKRSRWRVSGEAVARYYAEEIEDECRHAGTITRHDASGRTTCTACGAIFPGPIVTPGEFEGTTDEGGKQR